MGFTKDSPGGSVLVGMVSGSITVTNQHGHYHQVPWSIWLEEVDPEEEAPFGYRHR